MAGWDRVARWVAGVVAVIAVTGCGADAGSRDAAGTTPRGTAAAPSSPGSASSTAPPSPTTGTSRTRVTEDDLVRVLLRPDDFPSGWTAERYEPTPPGDGSSNPCQRPYRSDIHRTAAVAVGVQPDKRYARVWHEVAAYRPRAAHQAITEIRTVAQGCPRFTLTRDNGERVQFQVEVSKRPPPSLGDEWVTVAMRATEKTRTLHYVRITCRVGDVLSTVGAVAIEAQDAGRIAGVAAGIAARRLAESDLAHRH